MEQDERLDTIDYLEYFPEALAAQGRDNNFLMLTRLDELFEAFDGKYYRYQLNYRWLSRDCERENDEAWACVKGSENTYWNASEIPDALAKGANLFDCFNLF